MALNLVRAELGTVVSGNFHPSSQTKQSWVFRTLCDADAAPCGVTYAGGVSESKFVTFVYMV